MSLQQRIESENMCILVQALGYVSPDLSVRGSRIVDFSARPRSSEGSKPYHDKRESRQNISGSNRSSLKSSRQRITALQDTKPMKDTAIQNFSVAVVSSGT